MGRILLTSTTEEILNLEKPAVLISDLPELDFTKDFEKKNILLTGLHGLKRDEIKKDLNNLDLIYNNLIDEVILALNNFHEVNESKRYWEIIIGHWLFFYIRTIINRFNNLELALKKCDLDEVIIEKDISNKIYPINDTIDYFKATNDDYCQFQLYSRILSENNHYNLKVREIEYKKKEKNSYRVFRPKKSLKINLVEKIFNLLSVFTSRNDAFLIDTYLSTKELLKLQILLKQFPQLWTIPNLIYPSYDLEKREKLKIKISSSNKVETFIRKNLNRYMPICYLEGYNLLINKAKKLNWPKKPKLIFTSNAFERNELFKVWTAQKIKQKSKFIIGQHGNIYNTHLESNGRIEFKTSDSFLSWGEEEKNNTISAFNFKVLNRKIKCDENGYLTIVASNFGEGCATWSRKGINKVYFEWLIKLLRLLPHHIKKKTMVRLHYDDKFFPYRKDSIKKEFPEVKMDLGEESFYELVSKSRLVLFTHDSTGILENFTLNLPTMCFWPYTFETYTDEAVKYYKSLNKGNILHDNVNSTIESISNNWSNVNSWWNSEKTQNIRKQFCNKYSIEPSKNSLKKLAKILI